MVEVLRDFMETQQRKYDEDCRRKEEMHKERMEIFGGISGINEKRG